MWYVTNIIGMVRWIILADPVLVVPSAFPVFELVAQGRDFFW